MDVGCLTNYHVYFPYLLPCFSVLSQNRIWKFNTPLFIMEKPHSFRILTFDGYPGDIYFLDVALRIKRVWDTVGTCCFNTCFFVLRWILLVTRRSEVEIAWLFLAWNFTDSGNFSLYLKASEDTWWVQHCNNPKCYCCLLEIVVFIQSTIMTHFWEIRPSIFNFHAIWPGLCRIYG